MQEIEELVRAVNKLNKEREVKKDENKRNK